MFSTLTYSFIHTFLDFVEAKTLVKLISSTKTDFSSDILRRDLKNLGLIGVNCLHTVIVDKNKPHYCTHRKPRVPLTF